MATKSKYTRFGNWDECPGEESFGESRVLCPFCSTPWTNGMVKLYEQHGSDCYDSGCCTYGTAGVEIVCASCDRIIYKKEGREI